MRYISKGTHFIHNCIIIKALQHWEANQLNNKGFSNYLYIVLTSNKSLKQCDDLKSSFPQSDAHSHTYIHHDIVQLQIASGSRNSEGNIAPVSIYFLPGRTIERKPLVHMQ